MHKVFITKSGQGKMQILFLHGLWGGGNYFREVNFIKNLGTNYYPDELGFGKSEKPNIDYTPDVHCQSIFNTIPQNQKYIIVGHSFGTVLALNFAKLYPKLVKELVLISPLIYQIQQEAEKYLKTKLITRLTINNPTLTHLICLSICKTNILSFFSKGSTKHTWHSYYSSFTQCLIKTPIFPLAKGIVEKFPTLIIYGEKDKYISKENLAELSSKNLTVEKIADAGHDVMFEKIEYAERRITDWLK